MHGPNAFASTPARASVRGPAARAKGSTSGTPMNTTSSQATLRGIPTARSAMTLLAVELPGLTTANGIALALFTRMLERPGRCRPIAESMGTRRRYPL